MIDLDGLFRKLELVSRECCDNFTLSVDDTHELIIRLRQAEKDAARYRWLRDDAYNYLSGPMIFNCDYCGNPKPDDDGNVIAMAGSEVDLSVDEAMKCSK